MSSSNRFVVSESVSLKSRMGGKNDQDDDYDFFQAGEDGREKSTDKRFGEPELYKKDSESWSIL